MIRRLTCEDAAAAACIHSASFDKGWDENSLITHIKSDMCLGVFQPDLSGFIIMKPAADQAEIITLAVQPDLQGAGLGGVLVEEGCAQLNAAGVSVLFLEVAEDNEAAIALYRKCGFAPMGRRPAYYRRANGRVAALTYRKNI